MEPFVNQQSSACPFQLVFVSTCRDPEYFTRPRHGERPFNPRHDGIGNQPRLLEVLIEGETRADDDSEFGNLC